MISKTFPTGMARSQQGFALVVAIVLLLILTVFSMFAANVGVFEQRTSANEYRSRVVAQVADAGLNHGAETIRVLDKRIGPKGGDPIAGAADGSHPTPFWQPCNAADETFPCGAVPAFMRGDSYFFMMPDPPTAEIIEALGFIPDLSGDAETKHYKRRSVPFVPVFDEAGNARLDLLQPGQLIQSVPSADPADPFDIRYQIGLVLCRMDTTVTGSGVSPCTRVASNTTENRAYTLVARARMVGEDTGATFVRTVVPIQDVSLNPNVPSIVSSGVMNGLGSSTVVGNPNSGGDGLPVSIWTRVDFESSGGSWQTCPYSEWLRANEGNTEQREGGVEVCNANTCRCPTPDACREEQAGSPIKTCSGPDYEAGDILDVDGSVGGPGSELLDSPEFPRDLMEFLYGTIAQARDLDVSPVDGWNETSSNVHTAATARGDTYLIGQSVNATDFLKNAGFTRLTCAEATSDPILQLGPASSGKYWVETKDGTPTGAACPLPGNIDVGTPTKPVQLVLDGGVDFSQGMKVFGIIFGRDPQGVTVAGGDAYFKSGGGGAQVYGAAVIEGDGTMNGTVLVVFDAKVLKGEDVDFNPNVASVPGGWSDHRVSY